MLNVQRRSLLHYSKFNIHYSILISYFFLASRPLIIVPYNKHNYEKYS